MQEKTQLDANVKQLSLQLENRDHVQEDQHRALRSALLHLSRENKAPEDFGALVDTIEAVADKSAAHLKDIKDAIAAARADNAALETRVKSQGDEIYNLRERLGSEERQVFHLTRGAPSKSYRVCYLAVTAGLRTQ